MASDGFPIELLSLEDDDQAQGPRTWREQEDDLLKELVKRHGSKKWELVAARLPGRTAQECKDRWHLQLHAFMNKSSWTEEEDRKLLDARKAFGNKWTEIAQRVPGRTDNAVKNRYQALKKRQAEDVPIADKGSTFLMGPPDPQQPKPKRKYTKRATQNKESALTVIAEDDILRPSTSSDCSNHVDKKPCLRPDLSIQIPFSGPSAPALQLPFLPGPSMALDPLAFQMSGRLTPNLLSAEMIQNLLNSSLNETPRDSIDMDEVMGWLTAQTPTPGTHHLSTAGTTANNSLASSSLTSASNTPARLTPSPGNLAGFRLNGTGPSPRQLMSSVKAAVDDRRGFGFGHSPVNLMGPSLNVSELEDLVRLLSGSEGVSDVPISSMPSKAARREAFDPFRPPRGGSSHHLPPFAVESHRTPGIDHSALLARASFNDRIR